MEPARHWEVESHGPFLCCQVFAPLVEKCKKYGRALRIGTNHGSLSDRIMSYYGDSPRGMVSSIFPFLLWFSQVLSPARISVVYEEGWTRSSCPRDRWLDLLKIGPVLYRAPILLISSWLGTPWFKVGTPSAFWNLDKSLDCRWSQLLSLPTYVANWISTTFCSQWKPATRLWWYKLTAYWFQRCTWMVGTTLCIWVSLRLGRVKMAAWSQP